MTNDLSIRDSRERSIRYESSRLREALWEAKISPQIAAGKCLLPAHLTNGKKSSPNGVKEQSFNTQSKMEQGYSAVSALISVSLAQVLSETFYIKIINTKRVPSFLNKSRIGYAFSWHTFTWAKKSGRKDKIFYAFNKTLGVSKTENCSAVARKKNVLFLRQPQCSHTVKRYLKYS